MPFPGVHRKHTKALLLLIYSIFQRTKAVIIRKIFLSVNKIFNNYLHPFSNWQISLRRKNQDALFAVDTTKNSPQIRAKTYIIQWRYPLNLDMKNMFKKDLFNQKNTREGFF